MNDAQRISEERRAYLNTPEYDADNTKQAEKRVAGWDDWTTTRMAQRLSRAAVDKAVRLVQRPDMLFNLSDTRPATQQRIAESSSAANAQVRHNFHQALVNLAKVDILTEDIAKIEADPELQMYARINWAWTSQVGAIAHTKGDGESRFVSPRAGSFGGACRGRARRR